MSQIKEVSIDLYKSYKSLVNELMPEAEVVSDRFHVMGQVNDELDREVRRIKRETKKIKNQKKRDAALAILANSKYTLLKNEEDLTDIQKDKLEEVKKVYPELAIMHEQKESFRNIFEANTNWAEGCLELGDWLAKAQSIFPDSFQTIKRWIGEIVSYFDNRTTQGVVEGINNKLKLIKRRGF